MRKVHNSLIFFLLISNLVLAQYNPDNHVVTFSKYYLKDLKDVESGSSEERKKVFEEESQKMDNANSLLISKFVLGHRWTGSVNEVIQMAEWKSIADADKSIVGTADRRKKIWPDKEKREDFLKSFNKYWTGEHTDIAVMEQVNNRLKRYKGNMDENTVVTIVEFYLRPISEIEDGSSEEREELFNEYFNKVIMKNPKILSRTELRHYWSGSSGGGNVPITIVTEYSNIEDADNMSLNKAYNEKAWPNKEKRDEFFKKRNKYIAYGHKDIGIHTNWVNLAKR
ncbi:MAG: hypothetical protein CMG75_06175 [Candidatus Marinimicrobia bacterium]|nr:hypothetical protein [Candidatus Neomarinimicrobiota bacterium]|tara:strand:- start:10246 stop:11091 length:846 start_codon:yes stop_codon:yes gene_type:complete